MSAFQSYNGAYEHDGGVYGWQCYATARVYEIRCSGHGPLPKAPKGRKWVAPPRQDHEMLVLSLIDDTVEEFSQILLQVNERAEASVRSQALHGVVAAAAASVAA